MRDVERREKPLSLKKHSKRWTERLLAEIKKERSSRNVAEKFYDKYKKADIKSALLKMYAGHCCYCESRVKVIAKGQVEHRKPKKGPHEFPHATYDWDNLHWVCPTCNQAKGHKWNPQAPILDSVTDSIAEHLDYELVVGEVCRFPLTDRGETTIDHAGLNSDDLKRARFHIFFLVLDVMKKIREAPTRASVRQAQLREMGNGEYGSLIRWAEAWWSCDEP